MRVRLLTILPLLFLGVAVAPPAVAQPVDEWCVPSASIEVFANGSWVAATVMNNPDANGLCPITFDGFSAIYDESVGSERARPRGESRSFADGAPSVVTPIGTDEVLLADYHCVVFSGSRLYNRPGFTLLPGGEYVHDYGTTGTYAVTDGVVEFFDGDMDGNAGVMQGDTLRMFNDDRTGLVMDCEAR